MTILEILLIGAALAMDAVAVGMASGMAEPHMRLRKVLLIAGTFALFQFGMPLVGYSCGYAFSAVVERIAPYLSFALLLFIGGKMIFDCVGEMREKQAAALLRPMLLPRVRPTQAAFLGKLLAQGVATSLDALAVGVTLLATEMEGGLPFHVAVCAVIIGVVTFALSFAGVQVGRKAGDKFADTAGLFGGVVLTLIGIKLLVEGLL